MKKGFDKSVLTLAVVGSLAFVNLLAVKTFGRLDLTKDGQYTLAEATRDTLRQLHDPVTVKAYFTRDVPPPFSTNARYVRDLLEEYYAHGDGFFRYEFIDPTEEETAEDKEKKKDTKRDIFGRQVREATSIEQELQTLGIPPLQVQATEDDKLEVKRAYMGLAIKYADKTEVIPVVKETKSLEYDLTTLVRKLTRAKTPKVALVTGDSSLDPQREMGQLYGLLSQLFDVSVQNLSTDSKLAEDTDAILVFGSKTPYSDDAKRAIDSFVASGRSAAFLLDAVKPDLATLQAEEADHGLGELLASYGVKVLPGIVLDAQCATINIQQQRGFMRIAQPVRYPFMPMAQNLDQDHPLTRGLGEVALPFVSPLEIAAKDGQTAVALVKTSQQAWIQNAPYNLDPLQRWTVDSVGEQQQRNLLVTVTGPIASHFAPLAEGQEAAKGRLLVAGTSTFMMDQFGSPQNHALALNMIDWLVLDEALLAMRSRGLGGAALQELGDGTRALVKYGNIVGLPLLFVAIGLVRWRMREQRRARVQL